MFPILRKRNNAVKKHPDSHRETEIIIYTKRFVKIVKGCQPFKGWQPWKTFVKTCLPSVRFA